MPTSPTLRPAALKVRFGCLLYEALIAAAILLAATAVFTTLAGDVRDALTKSALQVFLLLVLGSYFVWSWTGGRRTLPMRTWHMRLIDRSGNAPSPRLALMRYLAAVVTILPFGLGLLWALFDPQRLFLHDRITGTQLIRDSDPSPAGRDQLTALDPPHHREREPQEQP